MNSLKIYFGEKPLIISKAPEQKQFYVTGCAALDGGNLPDRMMIGNSIEAVKDEIFKDYKVIKAGGGVVLNSRGEVLLIFRRNMWDLPKGKLEEEEDIRQCALREVTEETGLKEIHITAPLLITYHIYKEGSEAILKENHWYLMKYSGDKIPTPQAEEEIDIVKWVKVEDLEDYYNKTFPSIKDIFDKLRS